jgi:hypothetical protein
MVGVGCAGNPETRDVEAKYSGVPLEFIDKAMEVQP